MPVCDQKCKYWKSVQDAAKIDDYIGWGIGGLIMIPLVIGLIPMGLNVSWDDSSGRLAAVLLGYTIASVIITTVIASYNCVLWGSSKNKTGQCCRKGNEGHETTDAVKIGVSGCGKVVETDLRIGKLLMYLLPIIFSGMLFASMIISVNRGANAGHSFLVFFIPAMIVLTQQIQGFYLRIQERNAGNKKGLVGENYDYENDSAVMTRYSGYSTILIWLLTLGIMFSQTLFGGKMMPQWASGYKMIAWIIFTLLLIFFSLIETLVANVGGGLAPVIDPIICLFGDKDITGKAC